MAEPTKEELMARIAELESNPNGGAGGVQFKVGEKGGVSVYGLRPLSRDALLRTVGAPAQLSR